MSVRPFPPPHTHLPPVPGLDTIAAVEKPQTGAGEVARWLCAHAAIAKDLRVQFAVLTSSHSQLPQTPWDLMLSSACHEHLYTKTPRTHIIKSVYVCVFKNNRDRLQKWRNNCVLWNHQWNAPLEPNKAQSLTFLHSLFVKFQTLALFSWSTFVPSCLLTRRVDCAAF